MDKTHEEVMQELQDALLDINEQVQTIQAKADAENRDLTEDENGQVETLFAQFSQTEQEIDRRQRIQAQTERLRRAEPNKAEPNNPEPQNRAAGDPQQGFTHRERSPRIEIVEDRGKWGFRDFGEYAMAVAHANPRVSGSMDPRLRDIRNAPTTYSNESAGADGGFHGAADAHEPRVRRDQ